MLGGLDRSVAKDGGASYGRLQLGYVGVGSSTKDSVITHARSCHPGKQSGTSRLHSEY
jgi:hypothetical protein